MDVYDGFGETKVNVNLNKGGSFLGKVIKFILGLVLIGVLIGLVLIGINLYKNSQNGDLTKDPNIAIDGKQEDKGFFWWWDSIQNPKSITYTSKIDDSEEYQDVGVSVVSFEPSQSVYLEGNDIRGVATVEAASLSDGNSTMNFNCSLEDYYDSVLLQPATYSYYGNGNKIRKTVSCAFDGDKVGLSSQSLNTKSMTFKVNFDFVNEAYYKVYVIRKEAYDDLVSKGQVDIFDYYNVQDSLIKLNGEVDSKTTPGPVNLGLGTRTSQPFVNGEDLIFLGVTLKPNWNNGNIKYVKDLTLKITPEIVLDSDPNNCDFEKYGEEISEETGEMLYNLYRLTPYAFSEKVNIGCTKEELAGTGMTEATCMRELKSNVNLQCFFTIPRFPEEGYENGEKTDFVLLSPILAKVEYVYELEKKTSVDIRRNPNSDTDACTAYNVSECASKSGCQVTTVNDESICVKVS